MYLKLIGFAYTKVSSSFRRQHFPLWKEKRTWIEGNKIKFAFIHQTVTTNCRGIEWSLRAFANMRAVCLFLRARAVVKLRYNQNCRWCGWEGNKNFPKARNRLIACLLTRLLITRAHIIIVIIVYW